MRAQTCLFFLWFLCILGWCLGRDVSYFWQLTDVHVNPWYKVGSDVYNTKCNNVTSNANATLAGKYGDYHCESPWRLVNDALRFMASKKHDFVIWTGDDSPMNEAYPLSSPDLHMNQARVFEIVANLTLALQKFHVVPSLGNHEVWRPSELPGVNSAHTKAVFSTIGATWQKAGFIPSAQEYARFVSQGQMVLTPVPGLTVISLNTLWCDRGNLAADAHLLPHVDDLVFGFLADALHNATRVRSDAVWIIGHVPFLPRDCRDGCIDRYTKIMSQYGSSVKAHLYGHTHQDHFLVLRGSSIMMAPSLTPESWHAIGQNPAIRRYVYNTSSFEILDYEQYFLNLTAANAGTIAWNLEYSFSAAYGLSNLSPPSLIGLTQRLKSNSSLFADFWLRYRSLRTDTPPVDGSNKKHLLCLITAQTALDYEACLRF